MDANISQPATATRNNDNSNKYPSRLSPLLESTNKNEVNTYEWFKSILSSNNTLN